MTSCLQESCKDSQHEKERKLKRNKMWVVFFLVNQLKGSFLGAGCVFTKLCSHRKALELSFLNVLSKRGWI